jgi:hypothetical protein
MFVARGSRILLLLSCRLGQREGPGQVRRVGEGNQGLGRESGANREAKAGVERKGRDRELEEGREPGPDMEERLGQGIRGGQRGRVRAGNQRRTCRKVWSRESGADREERLGQGERVGTGN